MKFALYQPIGKNIIKMIRRSTRSDGKLQVNYNENTTTEEKMIKAQAIYTETSPRKRKNIKKDIDIVQTEARLDSNETLLTKKNSSKKKKKLIAGPQKTVKSEAFCDNLNIDRSNSKMIIGCHTSISGGLWKAPEEAMSFGARAFAMFTHNQQQWKMKPLVDGHAQRFKETCEKYKYAPEHVIPHGSYLMNCGSAKDEVREKSRNMLVEELKRCEELGLVYFNFHPGSTLGKIPITTCLSYIAEAINNAHNETKFVITLLENMSCQGNTVGGKFEELKSIIDLVTDKSRVGVCIDTCHAHAAGYDLSTTKGYDVFTKDLESIIGLQYVKAFHINDSKGPSGCKKDRHENIGKGTIGLGGFERLVIDKRFVGIPMILETPFKNDAIYKEEIELLYSLQS